MRTVAAVKIKKLVRELCLKANFSLRRDVLIALKRAYFLEADRKAKEILAAIVNNAGIAEKENIAICQDTGMPCVFVELGQQARIPKDLKSAINSGIEAGYREGFLRNSIVKNPLLRGRPCYKPAMIHIDLVKGDKIKLTVLPKGFGCENKTRLRMFNPTAGVDEVKKFIVETVRAAGPDACPPYIVGVGIGGTADYACLLAKKALLKKVTKPVKRQKLETELLREINMLRIGPMGLGGMTTALAVNIEMCPTHIAGLPVCVNISCHALRCASIVI